MDVNETLNLLRGLVTDAWSSDDDILLDIAQAFSDLDEWMTKGGAPPTAWKAD